MAYTIEGLDDCLKAMDKAPDNVLKMTKAAMRAAAKKTTRTIRQRLPKQFWRRLVRYKMSKGQLTQNSYVLMGLFNKGKKNADGTSYIPDWFKAYWANYGTLKHRDPSHHFDYPVKPATTAAAKRRRNNEGQMPTKDFEAAISGWEGGFMQTFEEEMVKQQDKLYDR